MSALLAVPLLLGAAGCDPTGGSSGGGSAPLAKASPPMDYPAAYVPDPGSSAGQSGADSPGPAASDEQLAQSGRRLFDGSRDDGALGASPDDAPAVPVPAGGPSRRGGALSPAPRRGKGAAGESAPKPDTIPPVPMPAPDDAGSASSRGGGPVLRAFEAFQRRMYDTVFPVYSRLAWHARPEKRREIPQHNARVTVHHTDGRQTFTEADTLAAVRNIQYYHMYGRAREGKDVWADIGYHFLIDGAGRVVEGRHADDLGSHVLGGNANNIGIAMIGDYNRDPLTDAQKESLKRLIVFLALKYRIDPRQPGFLEPHKHFNDTDCPGKHVADYLKVLRGEVNQRLLDNYAKLNGGFLPLVLTQPLPSNG